MLTERFSISPRLISFFIDVRIRREWLFEVMKMMLVSFVISRYVEFGRITQPALKGLEERYRKTLTAKQRGELFNVRERCANHT